MKSIKGKSMPRRNLTLNKNGDRESIFVSRNVVSSGYGQPISPPGTRHSSGIWKKGALENTNIFSDLQKNRRTVNNSQENWTTTNPIRE
jgi:hypothetical protein